MLGQLAQFFTSPRPQQPCRVGGTIAQQLCKSGFYRPALRRHRPDRSRVLCPVKGNGLIVALAQARRAKHLRSP